MAKAARWTTTDAEERKLGEQTGLDTLVVLALNDQDLGCRPFGRRPGANALSPAPGEYGRKTETQRNRRGPAQAVEHVVQFDATRGTLPGLEMLVTSCRNTAFPQGTLV